MLIIRRFYFSRLITKFVAPVQRCPSHLTSHIRNSEPTQFFFAGFDSVYSLWALSTVDSGGLNWSAHRIGQVREEVACLDRLPVLCPAVISVCKNRCPRLHIYAFSTFAPLPHNRSFSLQESQFLFLRRSEFLASRRGSALKCPSGWARSPKYRCTFLFQCSEPCVARISWTWPPSSYCSPCTLAPTR